MTKQTENLILTANGLLQMADRTRSPIQANNASAQANKMLATVDHIEGLPEVGQINYMQSHGLSTLVVRG